MGCLQEPGMHQLGHKCEWVSNQVGRPSSPAAQLHGAPFDLAGL